MSPLVVSDVSTSNRHFGGSREAGEDGAEARAAAGEVRGAASVHGAFGFFYVDPPMYLY